MKEIEKKKEIGLSWHLNENTKDSSSSYILCSSLLCPVCWQNLPAQLQDVYCYKHHTLIQMVQDQKMKGFLIRVSFIRK